MVEENVMPAWVLVLYSYIDGNKAYFCGLAIAFVGYLQSTGKISDALATFLYSALGGGGLMALRHAMQKDTNKTEAVQEKVDKIGIHMGVLPPPETQAPFTR
jgi:hypothetical protein